VYGCCGRSITSTALPSSTTLPKLHDGQPVT
jgi:hypothetical protein